METPLQLASSKTEKVLAHVHEKSGVAALPEAPLDLGVQMMAEEGTCPSYQLRVSVPAPFLGGSAWAGWGTGWLLTSQLQVPGRKGASVSVVPADVPGKTLVGWVTCRAGGEGARRSYLSPAAVAERRGGRCGTGASSALAEALSLARDWEGRGG